MRHFQTSPLEILKSLWHNRELIRNAIKREILGRYRGSFLGLFWSLLNPVFMLGIYTFVFSEIFQARWNNTSQSQTEFALVLFPGLIIFNLFSECINRAPSLILSNPNYVKKVIFPLETLPFVSLFSTLYHVLISFGIWLIAYVILIGAPSLTVLYLPLALMPFCLFILGLSWLLASLGVFLRDVSQVISVTITALMFLSPIFYPASALPETYRHFIYLNPLTSIIETTRDILFWGKTPEPSLLVLYWLSSGLIAWLGFAWFQKTRKGFADVL